MKKNFKFIAGLCVAFLVVCGLTACGENFNFTINFIVDDENYASVSTAGSATIEMPPNPTKDGYVFDGWYWDKGTWQNPFTANSLLDAPLSNDMSVYAKFVLNHTHEYTETTTKQPTCTEEGVKTFDCSCGDSYTETIPALGHSYGEWTIDEEPTCTAVGSKSRHCLRCSDKQDITEIPALGHDEIRHEAKAATCTESGWEAYVTCSRCDYTTFDEIPALGHNFVDDVCERCQDVLPTTEGLSYSLSADETSYTVVGIGTATDTDIVIPSRYNGLPVTSIGDEAFSYCSGLTSITIPDSVTSIETFAFLGCESLTSVTIGNGVTGISRGAFAGCSGLTSITIPDSVTSIGEEAFFYCSGLTSIEVASGNTKYHSSGNCLIETETNTLILGCETSVIPDDGSVTSIGMGAFAGCAGLTSITIPDSVTSIGYFAFEDCRGLTIMEVESGNSKYHSSGNCIIETETKILIAGCNTSIIPADGSVTSIGDWVFYNCRGLTSITIPDSVTSIGCLAFAGCGGITSVTIGRGVTSIGEYAFGGCSGLTSIVIPDSVQSIGSMAFSGCVNLTSIIVSAGNSVYHSACNCIIETETKSLIAGCNTSVIPTDGSVTSIDYGAFAECSFTSITIPDSITNIGWNAFRSCIGLTSIIIPGGVTSIGEYAFGGCSGLTSVTLPDSLKCIGERAFYNCNGLTSVTYIGTEREWSNIDIGSGNDALKNATMQFLPESISEEPTEGLEYSLSADETSYAVVGIGTATDTDIVIPSRYNGLPVTSILEDAFRRCSGLTSVTIPYSVTIIGDCAFLDCSGLTSIEVARGNTKYRSSGNCLIETKTNTLILGCNTSVIPDDGSVTSIGMGAFVGCAGLTSINIPNSVTSILDEAFCECSGLTSITIPDSVTSIGMAAFGGCAGLTSITIPDSVTSIGMGAFACCTNLTITVSAGNSVYHSVGNCIIETETNTLIIGCETSVIPTDGSVTSIGMGAFAMCAGLTSITIPDNVTSIGEMAFYGCNGLTSITIPDSVTSIGEAAFYYCVNLKVVNNYSALLITKNSEHGYVGFYADTINNYGREYVTDLKDIIGSYMYTEGIIEITYGEIIIRYPIVTYLGTTRISNTSWEIKFSTGYNKQSLIVSFFKKSGYLFAICEGGGSYIDNECVPLMQIILEGAATAVSDRVGRYQSANGQICIEISDSGDLIVGDEALVTQLIMYNDCYYVCLRMEDYLGTNSSDVPQKYLDCFVVWYLASFDEEGNLTLVMCDYDGTTLTTYTILLEKVA